MCCKGSSLCAGPVCPSSWWHPSLGNRLLFPTVVLFVLLASRWKPPTKNSTYTNLRGCSLHRSA